MNYKLTKGLISLLAVSLLEGCSSISAKKTSIDRQMLEQKVEINNFPKEKYALFINNSYEERHIQNLTRTYETLRERGFPEDNIYILDGDGWEKDLYPVRGKATKRNVKKILLELSKKIDSNDVFFLYVTGHGGKYPNPNTEQSPSKKREMSSTIRMYPGGLIYDFELRDYLKKINPQLGILLFDQCYGGGFAKKTGFGQFIGISASGKNEISWDDTFPRSFFYAWEKNSDRNGDGRISILEAFDYAVLSDSYNCKKITGEKAIIKNGDERCQSPQLYSEVNLDIAFLDGIMPNSPINSGQSIEHTLK